jgi:hypothetical protein
VRFNTTEPGKANLNISKRNKRVGTRRYTIDMAGRQAIRFDGRVRGKKLRAGRYIVEVVMEDAVGNQTTDPPFTAFTVRRTSRRR